MSRELEFINNKHTRPHNSQMSTIAQIHTNTFINQQEFNVSLHIMHQAAPRIKVLVNTNIIPPRHSLRILNEATKEYKEETIFIYNQLVLFLNSKLIVQIIGFLLVFHTMN